MSKTSLFHIIALLFTAPYAFAGDLMPGQLEGSIFDCYWQSSSGSPVSKHFEGELVNLTISDSREKTTALWVTFSDVVGFFVIADSEGGTSRTKSLARPNLPESSRTRGIRFNTNTVKLNKTEFTLRVPTLGTRTQVDIDSCSGGTVGIRCGELTAAYADYSQSWYLACRKKVF